MNEELKPHLIKFLEHLESTAKAGVDFASEQVPLVVQEYIAMVRVESTIYIILGLFMLFCSKWSMGLVRDGATNKNANSEGKIICGIYTSVFLIVFGGVLLICNTHKCVQSWVAPRVMVIEYVHNLLK